MLPLSTIKTDMRSSMIKSKSGFTLIELLITIAIIGILTMIGIPAYIGQQKSATRSEAYTNLQNLRLVEEQSFADSGNYVAGANTAAIRAALPRFQPGPSPSYDYAVTTAAGVGLPANVPVPYLGVTAALPSATTPCFIATATGIAGTRVAGDVFAIDCNNNRNF